MYYSFDGSILERMYAGNFVITIYIEENSVVNEIEYVAEIYIEEIGATIIRMASFNDLMEMTKFYINRHGDLIKHGGREKFLKEEKRIYCKAFNKATEIINLKALEKQDGDFDYFIFYWKQEQIQKGFLNYSLGTPYVV
ncbi:MAG: hypothetical protein M0P77_05880 [Firmicutes bacterium]|nr:hypothetical protein [Bacillota bacterium]